MSARRSLLSVVVAAALALAAIIGVGAAAADETCNSPYISKLIKGQEDYVYVWTLGVEGLGDGSDKLVTVDVNPKSKTLRQGASTRSRPARAARRTTWDSPTTAASIWAGGLSESRIWVFDIATDPAKPKLVQTIGDLGDKSGYLGPHTYYALPGRMLVQALSNTKDKGGVTGMALYNNKGKLPRLLRHADRRRRRRLRLRPRGESEEERAAHLELHRLRQLHAAARRARSRTARR